MMQLVDVDAQLRIDGFRAVGGTFKRARQMTLAVGEFRIVASGGSDRKSSAAVAGSRQWHPRAG